MSRVGVLQAARVRATSKAAIMDRHLGMAQPFSTPPSLAILGTLAITPDDFSIQLD